MYVSDRSNNRIKTHNRKAATAYRLFITVTSVPRDKRAVAVVRTKNVKMILNFCEVICVVLLPCYILSATGSCMLRGL